jgi:hypothetical protein
MIFLINVISMFLNFQGFPNYSRVVGHRCKDFNVIKVYNIIGVMVMLNNRRFSNMSMVGIIYIFFEAILDRFASLYNIVFSIRTRNLVNMLR